MMLKSFNKKKVLKISAVALAIGAICVGVWKGPSIVNTMIAYQHKVVLTKSDKKQIDEQMEQFKQFEKRSEREKLLADSKMYIEEARKMKGTSDDELYTIYLDMADKVVDTSDPNQAMQFMQMTKMVDEALHNETYTLKMNAKTIEDEYGALKKKYKGNPSLQSLENSLREANAFIQKDSLDIDEKNRIETELLTSYMKLYGGEKDANSETN